MRWRRAQLITPAIARKLLTHHAPASHFGQRAITRYAATMLAGRWKPDPPITLTRDGDYAVDGQHRLQAVILYGKPVRMRVTRSMLSLDDLIQLREQGITGWRSKPYQPLWDNGREIGSGLRECGSRYDAIAAHIRDTGLPNGFSCLDFGANLGYFSRRLADDFDAKCTAVDATPGLVESPGVTVVPRMLVSAEIPELGHHDLTLCLSVLHHYPKRWQQYLVALLASADLVFIELAASSEKGCAHMLPIRQELESLGGKVIGHTPTVSGDALRPLWVISND